MSERYITDRYLPDKAIDLIDEAASDVNLHNKDLARLAEIDKGWPTTPRRWRSCWPPPAAGRPQCPNWPSGSSGSSVKKDTLEMAVSRDDARRPTGGDPAFQERAGRPPPPNRRPSAPAHRSGGGKAGDSEWEINGARLSAPSRAEKPPGQADGEKSAIEAKGNPPLTAAHLARVIELWTKIPASQIQEQEFERLAKLEDRLKTHIVGQDEAVKAVANAIRRGRVGHLRQAQAGELYFRRLHRRGARPSWSSSWPPTCSTPLSPSSGWICPSSWKKHSVSRIIGSPQAMWAMTMPGQLTEKDPPQALLGHPLRRDREGPSGRAQRAAPDSGRRTHLRRPRQSGQFREHCHRHDLQRRQRHQGRLLGFDRTANQLGRDKAMKGLESFLRPGLSTVWMRSSTSTR